MHVRAGVTALLGALCGFAAAFVSRSAHPASASSSYAPVLSAHELWFGLPKSALTAEELDIAVDVLAQDHRIAVKLQESLHAGSFRFPDPKGWRDSDAFHGLSVDMAPSVIEAQRRRLQAGGYRIYDTRTPVAFSVFGAPFESESGASFLVLGPMISGSRRLVFAIDATREPDVYLAMRDLSSLGAGRPGSRTNARH